LLAVASRLQTYFSAKFFRKVIAISKEKKGGVFLAGGGKGNPGKAYDTACILLHDMNVKEIAPVVYSNNTDNIPAKNDEKAMEGARNLALFFNGKL
jgi:uridylate kinase